MKINKLFVIFWNFQLIYKGLFTILERFFSLHFFLRLWISPAFSLFACILLSLLCAFRASHEASHNLPLLFSHMGQLTCLRLASDLESSALMPYASSLGRLCAALLAFDASEVEEANMPVAPPYLFYRTDLASRLQEVLSLLAHWLPKRILLQITASPDCQQLLQVIFAFLESFNWMESCNS